jgi:DNA-binding NarL/FixJ family response regulator
MLSVLIIDNNTGFRSQLADLLNSQPDFEVVGQVGCASETRVTVGSIHPDLVLMDFNLPDGDSLHLAKEIQAICPQAAIVFLSGQADDDRMISAVRSGAKGYLLKSLAPPQLLASLRGLREGQAPISRTMVTRLLEEISRENAHSSHPPEVRAAVDRLTPREMDVLLELVKGGSNREIAARLYISEYTVKNHIHSILHKLEVNNRRQAAKYAQIYGLVA